MSKEIKTAPVLLSSMPASHGFITFVGGRGKNGTYVITERNDGHIRASYRRYDNQGGVVWINKEMPTLLDAAMECMIMEFKLLQ